MKGDARIMRIEMGIIVIDVFERPQLKRKANQTALLWRDECWSLTNRVACMSDHLRTSFCMEFALYSVLV